MSDFFSLRKLGWLSPTLQMIQEKKLEKLLIPDQRKYSALLKKFPSEYLAFLSDLWKKLSYTKKKRTQ